MAVVGVACEGDVAIPEKQVLLLTQAGVGAPGVAAGAGALPLGPPNPLGPVVVDCVSMAFLLRQSNSKHKQ